MHHPLAGGEISGTQVAEMIDELPMLAALGLYRMVNGQRLGRLLRTAAERKEAFAEALGINYNAARIQVFLISSAALGGIGGFYATYFKGASPSLCPGHGRPQLGKPARQQRRGCGSRDHGRRAPAGLSTRSAGCAARSRELPGLSLIEPHAS